MIWYADTPARRTRQVAADVGALAWALACVLAGRLVHATILQLAGPAHELRDASRQVEGGLAQARERIDSVPLVGERLADALSPLTGATGQVDRAALDFAAAVERLAVTAGLLTALIPVIAVVVPWLWLRVRFARRAGAARLLAGRADSLDLFALRALAHQGLPALARIDPDPAGAWRRGDPGVVRALAALELASAGLRPPPPRPDRPAR